MVFTSQKILNKRLAQSFVLCYAYDIMNALVKNKFKKLGYETCSRQILADKNLKIKSLINFQRKGV